MSHYTAGNIVEFLGKHLLHIYLKDIPSTQSIWNSDITRLSYLLREHSQWKKDKGGATTKELVIRPYLDYIDTVLQKFFQSFNNNVPVAAMVEKLAHFDICANISMKIRKQLR